VTGVRIASSHNDRDRRMPLRACTEVFRVRVLAREIAKCPPAEIGECDPQVGRSADRTPPRAARRVRGRPLRERTRRARSRVVGASTRHSQRRSDRVVRARAARSIQMTRRATSWVAGASRIDSQLRETSRRFARRSAGRTARRRTTDRRRSPRRSSGCCRRVVARGFPSFQRPPPWATSPSP
jgi:hypothetical protein